MWPTLGHNRANNFCSAVATVGNIILNSVRCITTAVLHCDLDPVNCGICHIEDSILNSNTVSTDLMFDAETILCM